MSDRGGPPPIAAAGRPPVTGDARIRTVPTDEPVTAGVEPMPDERQVGLPGDGSVGLVLAGGGAKAAFEAGAVLYLVEEEGLVPEVIAATSAGSVCAAVLAQARTHAELVERARELRTNLLALTHSELLFGKQPWLSALDGTVFGRAVERLVMERTRPAVPGEETRRPGDRRRTPWLLTAAAVVRALPRLGRAGRLLRRSAGSVLTLEPLARALSGAGIGPEASMARVADVAPIDPGLVSRPGLELRLAVVALGAGVLRYVTGEGRIVADDAVTPVPGPSGGPVDLADAVVASSSVPMVFPPKRLADDLYVDGGVASNVPVDAASRLGATRIVAILAVPLEQPHDHFDYSRASGLTVFLRAVGGIAFAERQRSNLRPPLPPGSTVAVIDPTVDIVGPFEVSQGLMVLDMDYGWMRAADVMADVDEATRRRAVAATDAVAEARTRAWHREQAMWASGVATAADLVSLAHLKRAVRDAVCERKGLGLPTPPDAATWWSRYELHAGPRPSGLPDDPLAAG